MQKYLIILTLATVLSLLVKPSLQAVEPPDTQLCPDGCVCIFDTYEREINGRHATCFYTEIYNEPGRVCPIPGVDEICTFDFSCTSDEDCDDNDACTLERCENGACIYEFKGCEDNDGCCPLGCVGIDNDCQQQEESCQSICREICINYNELCNFVCNLCQDCEECNNCRERANELCNVCFARCTGSSESGCSDESCNGICSYLPGEPCFNRDPDCYSCVDGTCANGYYCNNCQPDYDLYCQRCEHEGDGMCNCNEPSDSIDCQAEGELCYCEGDCCYFIPTQEEFCYPNIECNCYYDPSKGRRCCDIISQYVDEQGSTITFEANLCE